MDEGGGLGAQMVPAMAGGGGVDHGVARGETVGDDVAVAVVEVNREQPVGDVDHLATRPFRRLSTRYAHPDTRYLDLGEQAAVFWSEPLIS